MGEVINIKRSNDDDLLDQFESVCPTVPTQLNQVVEDAATLALGDNVTFDAGPSFKTVCIVLGCACVLGASMVRGFSTRWHMAVESAAAEIQLDASIPMAAALPGVTGDINRWQRSQTEWAAYIAHLESDPFYQHVLEEKRRFKQQHP